MANDYAGLIDAAGRRYNVDPALLSSQMRIESGGNPAAVSSAGAVGIMQLLPQTAKALGVDPTDPAQAIDGAAKLMRQNLDRYGDPAKAVAAYHGGTDTANWGPKTQDYVGKVAAGLPQGAPDHVADALSLLQPKGAPASGNPKVDDALSILAPSNPKETADQYQNRGPTGQEMGDAQRLLTKDETERQKADYNARPWYDRLLISAGQGGVDAFHSAQQIGTQIGMALGVPNATPAADRIQQTINEQAPASEAAHQGWTGAVGGAIPALPAAIFGAPASLLGSVAAGSTVGGGIAGLQPVVTQDGHAPSGSDFLRQKAGQILPGALAGAILPAGGAILGRAASAGVNAIRGAINPLTQSGAGHIADNLLVQQLGKNAAPLVADTTKYVEGSSPTLAQATNNPELAILTRQLGAKNPDLQAALVHTGSRSQAARQAVFDDLRGTPESLQQLYSARTAAATPLYEQAKAAGGVADATPILGTVSNILASKEGQRDAVSSALNKIQDKLITRVVQTSNGPKPVLQSNPEQLYGIRQAINDQLDKKLGSDAAASDARAASTALIKVRDSLDQALDKVNPYYGQARQAYADASRPIDVQEFLQLKHPTSTDQFIQARHVSSLLGAIEKGNLASGVKATDSFTPEQVQTLKALQSDFKRASQSEVGRTTGSDTAQKIAGTVGNVPLLARGLPAAGTAVGGLLGSVPGALLGQGIGAGLERLYGSTGPRVINALTERLLDPTTAARINALRAAQNNPSVYNNLLRYSTTPVAAISSTTTGK